MMVMVLVMIVCPEMKYYKVFSSPSFRSAKGVSLSPKLPTTFLRCVPWFG